MSGPSCTDVCEIIIDGLKSLGFKIGDDEDHTDIMEALEKCHLIKNALSEDQTVIAIDVEQFMRDNMEWEVPAGDKQARQLAKEFQTHLEEGLSAWITDEWEAFKKLRRD